MNQVVVVRMKYQSVASSSPQTSDGNWLVKVERFVTPLSASFTSRLIRPRGTFAGILQFVRALPGGLSRALRQFRQEPRSRFAYRFHSSVAPAFHEQKQNRLERGNAQNPIGEIQNAEC